MSARLLPAVAAVLAVFAAMSGCDTSFEAFEETERAYSIFGTLDANADVQYVRIEPLQDSTFAGTESFGARVTSEHLATGETALWRDSIFRVGTNDVTVHNFTTTADIEAGATYRFRVERERDGAASTAEVTLPVAFPVPTIINAPDRREEASNPGGPTKLLVRGVERLGTVRADYEYEACVPMRDCRRRQSTSYHLADTTRRSNGTIKVEINWQEEIPDEVGATLGRLYSFRVTVAAASEDWPEYAEDNPPGRGPEGQPLPPPGIESNVENGAGFLGGMFTRTVDVPIQQ